MAKHVKAEPFGCQFRDIFKVQRDGHYSRGCRSHLPRGDHAPTVSNADQSPPYPVQANLICPPQPHKSHIAYVDGDSLPFTLAASTADFNHLIAACPRDVKDLHHLLLELPLARALEDGTRLITQL